MEAVEVGSDFTPANTPAADAAEGLPADVPAADSAEGLLGSCVPGLALAPVEGSAIKVGETAGGEAGSDDATEGLPADVPAADSAEGLLGSCVPAPAMEFVEGSAFTVGEAVGVKAGTALPFVTGPVELDFNGPGAETFNAPDAFNGLRESTATYL